MVQVTAEESTVLHGTFQVDEFKLVSVSSVYWKNELRSFSVEDVVNMGASMMVHGQIEPIVVKESIDQVNTRGQEERFEGVCGRLRYEGVKHAHLQSVLIRVHKFSGPDEELEWMLAENVHRKELSALERAQAYGKLAELRRKSFSEKSVIAGIAMGVEALTGTKPAERTVREYLEIDRRIGNKAKNCGATSPSQEVGIRHLKQISRVADEGLQAKLLLETVHGDWTAQKLKQQVDAVLGVVKPKPISKPEARQPVACQACKCSLILVHAEDGTHKLLLSQRRV